MKIFAFVISFAVFVAGMYVLGLAFQATGYEAITFFGGILLVALGLAIPVHVLKRVDG